VASPYGVKAGHVTLPPGPGWGVEINPDWLARARHDVSARP